MAETSKPAESDLSDYLPGYFIKGKPFTTLVIAALTVGTSIGILAVICGGALLASLVGGAIMAAFTFIELGIQYQYGRYQYELDKKKGRENLPLLAKEVEVGHCQEPEPDRKTSKELMERGNQAVAPGRGR